MEHAYPRLHKYFESEDGQEQDISPAGLQVRTNTVGASARLSDLQNTEASAPSATVDFPLPSPPSSNVISPCRTSSCPGRISLRPAISAGMSVPIIRGATASLAFSRTVSILALSIPRVIASSPRSIHSKAGHVNVKPLSARNTPILKLVVGV